MKKEKSVALLLMTLAVVCGALMIFHGFAPTATAAVTVTAPSNLVVTVSSPYSVDLMWSDNSNNEKGFQVQRRMWARGSWQTIAQLGPNVTAYRDTAVVPGVTYYYQVRATGPSGLVSAWSNTDVDSTAMLSLGRLPMIDYFTSPVGAGDRGDPTLLTIGTCLNGYPKINFNDTALGPSGSPYVWYVATATDQNHWINASCVDQGLYAPGGDFHTGEDWNLAIGSNAWPGGDRRAPLYSIGTGIVIFNSGECMANGSDAGAACTNSYPTYKGGFGNTLIVAYRLPSGDVVFAVYAHLADPSTFKEGDLVGRGEQIGFIGSTGTGAYHLHLELRRQTMALIKSATRSVVLTEAPGFWPAASYADHGQSYIANNYFAPSTVIQHYARPMVVLGVDSASKPITPGGSVSFTVSLKRYNYTGPLSLHVSGLTIGFSAVAPANVMGNSANVTINAASSVQAGTIPFTIDAVVVGVTIRTVPASVVVGSNVCGGALSVLARGAARTATSCGPTLTALAISPSTIPGGTAATVAAQLSGPAPTGGASIILSSTSPVFPVPTTLVVPAGQSSASLQVSSTTTTSTTTAKVTGTYNGTSQSASVTITAPGSPLGVSCQVSQPQIVAGTNATFTGTYTGGVQPVSEGWYSTNAGKIVSTGSVTMLFPSPGSFVFTYKAIDSSVPAQSKSVDCSISVVAPAPLTGGCSISPPTITLGQGGTVTATASGGQAPYQYLLGTSGVLGTNNTIGVLPSNVGLFTYPVSIRDGAGQQISTSCNAQVVSPPSLAASCSFSPNPITLGNGSTLSAFGSGGTGGYQYSFNGSFYSATSSQVVYPQDAGTISGGVWVKDSTGATASASCSLSVQGAGPSISGTYWNSQPMNRVNFSGQIAGAGFTPSSTVWFCSGTCYQQPAAGVTVQGLTTILVTNVNLPSGSWTAQVRTPYGTATSSVFNVQ